MANITKRSNKDGSASYQIRVSAGYTTDGKQIVKRTTWKPDKNMTERQIEKELNRFATDFETKVLNGNYTDTSNIRLSDFCAQYLEVADGTLAPTTKEFYVRVIEKLIKPSLGHMRLRDIKPIHTQRFIQMLGGEGVREDKKGDRLSPATVKRYLTVLKSIMAQAYRLELVPQNPTETAKLYIPEAVDPDIEIFTKDETAQMLSCLEAEPLMFQAFVHLAIVTGCRRGELAALKWEHINLQDGVVLVKQSNYKLPGAETKSKAPKTKKSVREIAIPPYLVELLKRYHSEQKKEQYMLGSKWVDERWLFTKWNGAAMHPHTPTRQFAKFLKKNGIPHRKLHALRHTSATLLLASGVNVKTVASRLGHTQLSTTDRYVHALRDADEAAAQMFEGIVKPPQNADPKERKTGHA